MAGHWWFLTVFAVFLVALFAFHIPILSVRRNYNGVVQDPTLWKWWWEASDYLSVGLASIALLPAAMEFSRASTTTEFRTELPRINRSMGLYTVENNRLIFAERAQDWKNIKPALEWWTKIAEIYGRAEKLKLEGTEFLRSSRFSDADDRFHSALQVYDEVMEFCKHPYDDTLPYSGDCLKLPAQVQRDAEEVVRIEGLGKRMSKSVGELLAAFLSPWFLCVALAVRIAKVSSKVCVKEAK